MNAPFVYALVDPLQSSHVRYVGMTTTNAKRPYHHAANARKTVKHSHLYHWIRGLQSDGREPDVLILEALPRGAPSSFVGFVEKCYIKSLREIGHRLTNLNDGGEGQFNPVSETRAKMRAAKLGTIRSLEARARQSATTTGRKQTREHGLKVSQALKGHSVSPETRAKISASVSASLIGNKRSVGRTASEETRAKMRAAHLKHNAEHPETNIARSLALLGKPKPRKV